MMHILALDLGTRTGWAAVSWAGNTFGTWDTAPGRYEEGLRYLQLRRALDTHARMYGKPDEVWFEQVHRHVGTEAAHVYGGLRATMKVWAIDNGVALPRPVGVGQIKKFWTGAGNAKKDAMIAEAQRRGFAVKDDNAADALALLHYRLEEGPGIGEKVKAEKRPATREEIERRSMARRAARRLRAGYGGLPEAGG